MLILLRKKTDQIRSSSEALMETDIFALSKGQRQAVETMIRSIHQIHCAVTDMSDMTPEQSHKYLRHDFLNLITPLLGYAEMLREGWIGTLDQQQQSIIETIASAANEMRDKVRAYVDSTNYTARLA